MSYDEGMMLHCCNVCGEWWRTEITRKEREMSPDWCMCAPWSLYMLNKSLINPPNIHFSSSAVLYRSFRMLMAFTNGAWRVWKSIHVRIVVFGDFITIILFLLDFNCFWVVFGVELRCLAVITTCVEMQLSSFTGRQRVFEQDNQLIKYPQE